MKLTATMGEPEITAKMIELVVKAILLCFLVTVSASIAIGVAKLALAAYHLLDGEMDELSRTLLTHSLAILAMVEIFRTGMAYFTEGRVKVTYIIDTVLVMILTEILGFWHMNFDRERIFIAMALVVSLGVVRVIAIRFSPNRTETADGL